MQNPKFIIKDGEFILGRAEFHRDLAGKTTEGVEGGGWWHFDREKKELTLFSSSSDFGHVTQDRIIDVLMSNPVPRQLKDVEDVYHSYQVRVEDALEVRELIIQDLNGNKYSPKNSSK